MNKIDNLLEKHLNEKVTMIDKSKAFKATMTTGKMGEISSKDLTREKLIEVFGEPNLPGTDNKVKEEWVVQTPDGVATIYLYKDSKDWSVGGKTKKILKHIAAVLDVPVESN